MTVSSTIGNRVKKMREINGYSQEQFAQMTGLSRPSISNYENGNRTPDAEALLRMADALNISMDYLFGLSDVKTANLATKSLSKETGLTEKAIEVLRTYHKRVDVENPMLFINTLLEEARALYIISLMIDEFLYADDSGYSYAELHRVNGGRLMACQEALFELINKIRGVEEGTDNQKKMPCTESPIINKRR